MAPGDGPAPASVLPGGFAVQQVHFVRRYAFCRKRTNPPPVAKSEPVRTSAAHVNIESDALPQFVMVDDGMAAVPPEAKAITHSQICASILKVSAPSATAATTDWRHVLVVAWLVGAGLLLVRLLVSSHSAVTAHAPAAAGR